MQKYLCDHLYRISTDWAKWRIFFCDERVVDFENDDSTYKYYRDHLIGKAPIYTENIFPINPELPGIHDWFCHGSIRQVKVKVFSDNIKLILVQQYYFVLLFHTSYHFPTTVRPNFESDTSAIPITK